MTMTPGPLNVGNRRVKNLIVSREAIPTSEFRSRLNIARFQIVVINTSTFEL